MTGADKKRFLSVLEWLCHRYKEDGEPRPLPDDEDLKEYFQALQDLPIADIERGGRWHYGHSEFYPVRPAALRKSVEGWRAENPQSVSVSAPLSPTWLDEARRKPVQPVDTRFGSEMVILFDALTIGQITADEHTDRLEELCMIYGIDSP